MENELLLKAVKFRIDNEHNVGVLKINGAEFVIFEGDFTARGAINFLRPYDKAKDKLHNVKYASSKRDVVYYMDNDNVSKCLDVLKDLRHEQERQKW